MSLIAALNYVSSNIEEWMAIFDLILDEHANSLTHHFVLGHTMSEVLGKDVKIF
jgi:hypothetical protein